MRFARLATPAKTGPLFSGAGPFSQIEEATNSNQKAVKDEKTTCDHRRSIRLFPYNCAAQLYNCWGAYDDINGDASGAPAANRRGEATAALN